MTTRRAFGLPFAVRVAPGFVNLFFLMLVFVVIRGDDSESVSRFVVGFLVTGLSLLLHELGHAFVARRLGLEVEEVVVHPLGGMAKLLWKADDPGIEAKVSVAGPATNLVLAALVYGAAVLGEPSFDGSVAWLAATTIGVNLVLGLGNLLPAFPMDGGRILRAALARKLGYREATRIAARVGRFCATALVVAPFPLSQTTDLRWPALLALPLLGATIFVLGEWERIKAEASLRASGPTRAAGFSQRAAPSERRDDGRRDDGVLDVEGTSRVVEDP